MTTKIGSDERRHPFFIIDNIVVDEYHLTPYEGWLYAVIVRHINQKTGVAFPSLSELKTKSGMSERQVVRTLKRLQEKKLISITSRKRKGTKAHAVNHYRLIDPHKSISETGEEIPVGGDSQAERGACESEGVVPVSHSNKTILNKTTQQDEKLAQPDKSVAPAPLSDQAVSDVVEEPPVSTPAPKPKPAPRRKTDAIPAERMNPMKDAIAAAFGWQWDSMTAAEKSQIQGAARKLCEVKVNPPPPSEVAHIHAYCKATFTHFTPYALSAHLNASRQWNGVKPGGSNAQHDDFRPAPRDDSKYAVRTFDPTGIPADSLAWRNSRTNPLVPRGLPRPELAPGTGELPDVCGDESGDAKRAA